MTRILLIVAAFPFLLMGAWHGVLTLRDLKSPKAFVPRDPALLQAMQRSGIRLHRSINLWRAWLGFNFSHSLGLVLFGAMFMYVGVFEPALFVSSLGVQTIAVSISALYLVLCVRFFFSTPAIGSAIGLISFLAAAGLAHV